jgi:hypothetical protein
MSSTSASAHLNTDICVIPMSPLKLRIGDCGLRIVMTTFSFFNLQFAIRNFIISGAAPLHEQLQ